MGNTPGKTQNRPRNKKYLYLKGAERPSPPGKPYLVSDTGITTPDVLTIHWDPPLKDGGTTLTGYLVEHRRTGSPHWVRATPLLTHLPELTLSGLEPGWRYQFRVFAENLVGLSDPSELSEPLTVTLQRSVIVAPKFTKELQDTIALENDKVEFVVYYVGQPAPKLCWFKDGFEIFSSRRTRVLTEHDRSVLTIHQCAICDQGEIKCTATNKAGHASTKAQLTLEAPPCIRLPRQYEEGLLFEIGEVIRLKVSIAGLPAPLVFWSHDGESINECERYEIENDSTSSTLRIAEAHRNDRGEYQIKAANKLGSDVASFLVTVTDKPAPPGKAKVMMTLGRSVTLSWSTPNDDGGSKIGNYIIEYYRLGWNVWLKAATTKQLSTILGDLIEGSEYKFRVKAESPFGVSEPSEESELVFIADPKRGILQPNHKSRSQDLIDDLAPVAAKRKKPRSQSSSRYGDNSDYDDVENIPSKSERLKLPSQSLSNTPNLSPHTPRKQSILNKSLFDRESIYKDITYGSPDIKMKRPEVPSSPKIDGTKSAEYKTLDDSKRIPNDQLTQRTHKTETDDLKNSRTPSEQVKSRSPSPNRYVQRPDKPNRFMREKSPNSTKPTLSRDNSENLGGSTEFMMVLFPDEIKDMEAASDISYNERNLSNIPPPLSLSAPELGTEPPKLEELRYSVSSTELLHERAMFRFYEEALAEEEIIKRKIAKHEEERRPSVIPRIQINSRDDENIVGLERKHSLRRRMSAGGTVPQNILLAQKRHSLRNSGDFSDLFDMKFSKNLSVEERREIMKTRQRSESEEKEEEEFEKIRVKVGGKKENRSKKISVVREESWEMEDETFELEESSEDERLKNVQPKSLDYYSEEEDQTYHPRMENRVLSKYEAPFEILNKPAKLPDENFVPKPILKKKNNGELSPPIYSKPEEAMRGRSNSLIDEYLDIRKPKLEITVNEEYPNTSAIASAGLAAAGIVISQPILKQKAADDAKVIIDHYEDIVKTRPSRNVNKGPENNPIREALRRAAAMQAAMHHSDEEDHEIEVNMTQPTESKIFADVKTNKSTSNRETIDRRLKEIEQRMENTSNVSKLPGKNTDDVYPKLPQAPISKLIEKPVPKEEPIIKFSEKPAPKEEPSDKNVSIRGRETTRPAKQRTGTCSKSPKRSISKGPITATEKTSSRSSSRTRAPSKTPSSRSSSVARNQNSQSRSNSLTRPPSRSASKTRKSPSPGPQTTFLRKPKMCEIMTQTSTNIDPFVPNIDVAKLEQIFVENLKEEARVKVRSSMDYITDLAMFAVVIWVFLFSNELLAIPFLLIAVYRQLNEELGRWVPQWIRKRWNKPKKQ